MTGPPIDLLKEILELKLRLVGQKKSFIELDKIQKILEQRNHNQIHAVKKLFSEVTIRLYNMGLDEKTNEKLILIEKLIREVHG